MKEGLRKIASEDHDQHKMFFTWVTIVTLIVVYLLLDNIGFGLFHNGPYLALANEYNQGETIPIIVVNPTRQRVVIQSKDVCHPYFYVYRDNEGKMGTCSDCRSYGYCHGHGNDMP